MTTADPIADFRSQLRAAAIRRRRSARRRLIALAVVGLGAIVAVTGVAMGGVGWLTGTPAPGQVISDFGNYTPQLGFHPDAGSAVLVASDGDSRLYATTNAEGSYCVAVSTSWRNLTNLAKAPDGGTCITKATADQPIVAGIPSAKSDELVLAGRVSVAGAVDVRLDLPDGSSSTIALGTSGFSIANIQAEPCKYGTWSPQLVALDSAGKPVAASTIRLERPARVGTDVPFACWAVGAFGPTATNPSATGTDR